MPVTYGWYDDDETIIMYRLSENWTLQELSEGNSGVYELVKDISRRFDVIVDLMESTYVPPVGALGDWKQNMMVRDALFSNWGLMVVINKSRVIEAYLEEGIQTSDAIRRHTRFAKTIEEAIQLIQVDRTRAS